MEDQRAYFDNRFEMAQQASLERNDFIGFVQYAGRNAIHAMAAGAENIWEMGNSIVNSNSPTEDTLKGVNSALWGFGPGLYNTGKFIVDGYTLIGEQSGLVPQGYLSDFRDSYYLEQAFAPENKAQEGLAILSGIISGSIVARTGALRGASGRNVAGDATDYGVNPVSSRAALDVVDDRVVVSGNKLLGFAEEPGSVQNLLYGAKVGEGLPGSAGVRISGRPSVQELTNLSRSLTENRLIC